MRKSSTPLFALLILGLTAALYFVFQSPSSSGAGDSSDAAVAEEVESAAQSEKATGVLQEAEGAITREDAPGAQVNSAPLQTVGTEVEVLNPEGQGVVGARVLHWIGEELQDEVLTDEAGRVTLDNSGGEGGYAIMAPGYPAVHALHDFDGSPIQIHLRAGLTVSGRVVFKRPRVSQEPFSLKLLTLPFAKLEGVPKSVQETFWRSKSTLGSATIQIDVNGNFQFDGLPQDWEGRLDWYRGYTICSLEGKAKVKDRDSISIATPTTGLILELVELPAFTGRIVTPDGSAGIAGIDFSLVGSLVEDLSNSFGATVVTDEDGFFRAPVFLTAKEKDLWCGQAGSMTPYRAWLNLRSNEQWAGQEIEIDLTGKDNPWDLGSIAMKETMKLKFQALDLQGKPIQAALAFGSSLSEPTDPHGFGQVILSKDTETIFVGAKGFEAVGKKVPESLDGILVLTLPSAVRLHVKWSVPEGADMSGAAIIFRSEGKLFKLNEEPLSSIEWKIRRKLGPQIIMGRGFGTDKPVSSTWSLDADQRTFELWGLEVGVPMEIMIVDQVKFPLASSQSLVFQPGEEREVELLVPVAPVDFVGTVVDQSGAPIRGVRFFVYNEVGDGGWGFSGSATGEFRISCLAAEKVDLTLEKDGFARQRFDDLIVPRNGEPVELVMERAREVVVFLQDTSGRFYAGGFFSGAGPYVQDESLGNGGVRFSAMPETEFPLDWQIGGAKGTAWIPEGLDEYTVEIPVMASVYFKATRVNAEERESVHLTFVPMNASAQDPEDSFFERSLSLKAGVRSLDTEYPVLLPGEYMVKYSTWCNTDGKWGDQPLGEQGPFTVLAGQVLQLQLDF